MPDPARIRILPSLPRKIRFALAGCVVAMLAYALARLEPAPAPKPDDATPPAVVPLPALDDVLLATARDATREQRLVLDVEPLRHLLAKAIDVGPTVATALGMPDVPVPVAEVRANLESFRRRWLCYEGVLEELSGARDGHPIRGYSIYEATVKLADGNHVLAAFSLPPPEGVRPGRWVRVEGYLMKLRDTTYPTAIEMAPMLVGRAIQADYEDWGPVTALDPALLDRVDDTRYGPADKASMTLEEDQTEPLWHLAAFVRDTASQRSADDWRRIGTLNTREVHQQLVDHRLPRGTPLRIFGALIQRTSMAAPSNPAGIRQWTVAWVQVREYGGGALVPVWIPKRVEVPTRAQLEVRGFFYRWFAYDTIQNERRRVPLFVAADLDVYELGVDRTMQAIGLWVGGFVCLIVALGFWSQRRASRLELQHSRDIDRRRRRRRQREQARSGEAPTTGD